MWSTAPATLVSSPLLQSERGPGLRWLVDLGAESLVAPSPSAGSAGKAVLVSVPGAAYVFSVGSDGSLQKRIRLGADASAPYGVAVADRGLALADRQGSVALWTVSAEADPSVRWRRDLAERVTSVGWAGGERILVATWKGRLVALAAADGRLLWSVDLAGRAEAPAVTDGGDVFVATKARAFLRLDAATGTVRWKVPLPGPALYPPAIFGQRPRLALCGTWDGQLLAHDVHTGRVRWSAQLPSKLAAAPAVGTESVSAVTADGAVHTYDAGGNRLWTAPDAADGPAALLRFAGAAPRLLSVSKALVALDLASGARLADYPHGAVEDLHRRFADAMLEGVKTYSEGEKRAVLEREAFDIPASVFGPARLFGPHVAFGTEDGWAYLFDAATLRPRARYRAGQPCSSARSAAGRVLAVAGEELFALEPVTGTVLWKRVLGADPGPIAGEATLGVVGGGRVHAVSARDGALQWSLRGRFRSVAPSGEGSGGTPWLVDDGEGNLRALLPPGRPVGEPLPAGGELLPLRAASEGSWVAATREGKVFGVAWEGGPAEGRLVRTWEAVLAERIIEIHVVDGRVFVRTESGPLANLDETSRQETWRLPLSREDRIQFAPQAGALLVLGGADVRVHDCVSGEMVFQRKVPSSAVGADLQGTSLRWLDRGGGAYRVDVHGGLASATAELGIPLAEAVPVTGGFLVTTAAGEVGFVDVAARND